MVTNQNLENTEKLILIDQHNYSGVDATETMIIRDAKSLKAFYTIASRTRKPGLPVPDIDFTKELVVIHCSPDKNYKNVNRLFIRNESDDEVVIGFKKITKTEQELPASNDTIFVSPFFVYKLPFTKKKLVIEQGG